jgi:NADPH-dependent 2,4-dienoyl-CoA reductase/sulfur reductase-like enzyme
VTADLGTIVVVGASLAGVQAADTLREQGFEGRVVLVGAEPHLPYDRPPLSKELLAGTSTPEDALLRPADHFDKRGIDLVLETTATSLDLHRRVVHLADAGGDTAALAFDGLVVATGAAPRHLRGTGRPTGSGSGLSTGSGPGSSLEGVHVLRTLDDCLAISAALDTSPRVVVVGAGFIGAEVAATCRGRGLDVTVVEALPVPLAKAVGPAVGAALAELHRDNGVALRTGVGVAALEGAGRLERVVLADGSAIEADLVVVGVGVAPRTAWLEDSGLTLDDGLVCDAACVAAPGVVAAGDVARWDNQLFGGLMRVEHWTNAVEQGAAAATSLLAAAAGHEPPAFAPVPYFWSDQYGRRIQYVGASRPEDEMVVVDGSLDQRRFVAIYGRDGRIVAALAVGRARHLMAYRRMIAARGAWDAALKHAAG